MSAELRAACRETFRRHRVLFCLPLLIGALAGIWLAAGTAPSYLATTNLWVDSAAPLPSSLDNVSTASTPPSTQEQTILQELLATPNFVLAVGHGSQLGAYLKAHPTSGFGPSALVSKLTGAASLNSRIEAALGPEVTTALPGPQVLSIGYTGPTAAIAKNTLQTLVNQLLASTVQLSQQYGASEASYYRSEEQAATAALLSARQQADLYLTQHPGASASSDPNYATLAGAEASAGQQLDQAAASLHQAAAAGKNSDGSLIVETIDPASIPDGAVTGGKKADAEAVVEGLLAGAVISFLIVLLLTLRRLQEPMPVPAEVPMTVAAPREIRPLAAVKPAEPRPDRVAAAGQTRTPAPRPSVPPRSWASPVKPARSAKSALPAPHQPRPAPVRTRADRTLVQPPRPPVPGRKGPAPRPSPPRSPRD